MKVLFVCGGRNFGSLAKEIVKIIDREKPDLVMHGDAPGADRSAHLAAIATSTHVGQFPALWSTRHRGAGPQRNELMKNVLVALEKGDWDVVCHAYLGLGSKGTKDMIGRLEGAGFHVEIHEPEA